MAGNSRDPERFNMNEEQSNTYRIDPALKKANVAAVVNAEILAELGELAPPLKLVDEKSTEGTTITKIDVHVGKTIHEGPVWAGELTCVDRIELVAYTSDGRVEFRTRVCMAVQPPVKVEDGAENPIYRVHVTPEARDNPACQGLLWDHLGGELDCGDTRDTQLEQFDDELRRFWAEVVGPDEHLRAKIIDLLEDTRPGWRSVTVSSDGRLIIQSADGSEKIISPPTKRKA